MERRVDWPTECAVRTAVVVEYIAIALDVLRNDTGCEEERGEEECCGLHLDVMV